MPTQAFIPQILHIKTKKNNNGKRKGWRGIAPLESENNQK
jgi:hypothetical protein